jgi:hypothetical protein
MTINATGGLNRNMSLLIASCIASLRSVIYIVYITTDPHICSYLHAHVLLPTTAVNYYCYLTGGGFDRGCSSTQ